MSKSVRMTAGRGSVKREVYFITGTDTAVGKTVLAGLLEACLRRDGVGVAALKPVSAGGRADARLLWAASAGALTLDEINPWHFRAPLAPRLAARREQRRVRLRQVLAHVRRMQERFPVVIVEGAGGVLSPLGEDFDSCDLIRALRARPIVVCPDRLGAVNQTRLVLAALPASAARRTQIVLMARSRRGASNWGNGELLGEIFGRARVHVLPRLKFARQPGRALANRAVRRTMRALLEWPAGSNKSARV